MFLDGANNETRPGGGPFQRQRVR